MKKKHPVLLGFLIIIVIMLGWKSLEKPRQIGFLVRHEEEMTEYIKAEKLMVESVNYSWEKVDIGIIGNGLPWGGGKRALVSGYANDNPNLDFRLYIEIDNKGIPKMSTMQISQPIDW